MASNQHHRSQTDKPEPTSDAQERAGRLEHTHDSSPGQMLKSPARQGIAESERHESIHSILRKAVQRHTHYAIRVGMPAVRCWHHASTICQGVNKFQSTPWFRCHLQEVAVCDVMWTATWRQSHATELICRRKVRSIHKAGQQNLWRSPSNHPKANQSQNTSHSIVAGAHRRQWGHILDDQQRRNGKIARLS